MYTAVNMSKVIQYKSPNDPDQSNPTIFDLGPIDIFAMSHIEDKTTSHDFTDEGQGNVSLLLSERAVLKVMFGLKGMRNFRDDQGNEVVVDFEDLSIGGIDYRVVSKNTVRMFDPVLIRELANQIDEMISLKREEKKPNPGGQVLMF